MSAEFPTDYASVLARIEAVNPPLYARTRNHLDGAVSRLSPYLTHGFISLPQVASRVMARFSVKQAEKFLQELAWREYFHRLWWQLGDGLFGDLRFAQPRVVSGQLSSGILNASTGIEALDATIQELYETGYMHNHARMWIAMLACSIARTAWPEPARWMYYHLLDGDLASNTASWQWVAGTFRQEPYWANQDNINHLSGSSQSGSYLDVPYSSFPLAGVPASLKERSLLNLQTSLPETPAPRLKSDRVLLYHPWSLSPMWHQGEAWDRVLVLEPGHFNKFPVSPKRVKFILDLAAEIPGLQVYVGEVSGLALEGRSVLHKSYPAVRHFPGDSEPFEWLFPEFRGEAPMSFTGFWNKVQPSLERLAPQLSLDL